MNMNRAKSIEIKPRDEINNLVNTNVPVRAVYNHCRNGGFSYEEVLEYMVIQLAKREAKLTEDLLKLYQSQTSVTWMANK